MLTGAAMKLSGLVMMTSLLAMLGAGGSATAGVAAGSAATALLGEAQASGSGKPDSPGSEPSSTRSSHALLNRAYLLGRWTDNGDCSNAIELSQDATFTTATGARGLWNLDDDRLTMSGRNTLTIRIAPIDQNTITVINGDGSLGRSTRC